MIRKSIAFVHRHRDFNLSNINVNSDSSFYLKKTKTSLLLPKKKKIEKYNNKLINLKLFHVNVVQFLTYIVVMIRKYLGNISFLMKKFKTKEKINMF